MISPMTTARPQQCYDHRLRELVHRTGDLTIATDLGVPPSTARGWLGTAPTVVVSLEVADLTELELRQEVLTLRRRVQKLAALLRLALVLLRVSGFTLSGERLLDRSEEHTSELQSLTNLVCRLLLEKKNKDTEVHAAL